MPTTHYLWDVESDNVLMEKDHDGNTTAVYTNEPTQYGKVLSQHRDGQTSYYNFDGQGSTRQLTDENQNVTDEYTYSAFGEPVAHSGTTVNPFRYVGAMGYYMSSESSDFYIRARCYDPSIARWYSPDPINSDVISGFQYSRNSPVTRVDPNGLLCIEVGPLNYDKCGNLAWGAQFHLNAMDKADLLRVGGGFVVQRVCVSMLAEVCPDVKNEIRWKATVPCQPFGPFLFNSTTPWGRNSETEKKIGTLCYWELWPLNGRGQLVVGNTTSNHILDEFNSNLGGPLTEGRYYQEGTAYFMLGREPPDGWNAWTTNDPSPPAKGLPYRCDTPSHLPKSGAMPSAAGRIVNITWNCCVEGCLEPDTIPKKDGTGNVLTERDFEVWGSCAK